MELWEKLVTMQTANRSIDSLHREDASDPLARHQHGWTVSTRNSPQIDAVLPIDNDCTDRTSNNTTKRCGRTNNNKAVCKKAHWFLHQFFVYFL